MKIFSKASRGRKGFTLIELLVVIAIIGILSAIVLVSVNSGRQKARDARRISDVRQLQVALTMYYEANGATYPATLAGLAPTYISAVPLDPDGTSSYQYCVSATLGYHLGTKAAGLEQPNTVLNNDADAGVGSNPADGCASGSFLGTDPAYDVTRN